MVNMEITRIVASLLRGMECLILLLLGLSISAYSGKLKEYVMPSETCGYIVDRGEQFQITSAGSKDPDITTSDNAVAAYGPSYPDDVDCEISFRTSPDKKFFVRITHFQLELSSRCENDVLIMYDGSSASDTLVKKQPPHGLCGKTLSLPNYFHSTGSDITVKFRTNNKNNSYSGFVMLLTPYYIPPEGENCTEDEMMCKETRKCFTRDAYCNGVTQCSDSSDEPGRTACSSAPSFMSGYHITGLVLTFIITYIFTATDLSHGIYRPRHTSTT